MAKVNGKGKDIQIVSKVLEKRYTGCMGSSLKTSEENFPTQNQGKILCQYITVYFSLHSL
jgi:hypothetical protein